MRNENDLVFSVWEIMRDHIPAGKRIDAAISLYRSFIDFGFEAADFSMASDEDDTLKAAYALVFHPDDEDEEEEFAEE